MLRVVGWWNLATSNTVEPSNTAPPYVSSPEKAFLSYVWLPITLFCCQSHERGVGGFDCSWDKLNHFLMFYTFSAIFSASKLHFYLTFISECSKTFFIFVIRILTLTKTWSTYSFIFLYFEPKERSELKFEILYLTCSIWRVLYFLSILHDVMNWLFWIQIVLWN